MRNLMTACLLVSALMLAACGEDAAAPRQQAAAPSAKPAAAAPAAAPAAPAMPEATDDEEIQYDPIDVSKLDSQWWQQYSAGS